MTPEQLREDVLRKAYDLNIRVSFSALPFEAFYDRMLRFANVQPIRDYGWVSPPGVDFQLNQTANASYFVALHELGHAATLPDTPLWWMPSSEETLTGEAVAWDWAQKHSAIPVDQEMTKMATVALRHYQETSDQRTRRNPPAVFSQTLRSLESNELATAA